MKTPEEIEKLKADWKYDPMWDIETSEGFEDHHGELLTFRLETEAKWKSGQIDREYKSLFTADAFPQVSSNTNYEGDPNGTFESSGGLTKREYFAGMALQAVDIQAHVAPPAAKFIAESAVNIADALIEALSKPKEEKS